MFFGIFKAKKRCQVKALQRQLGGDVSSSRDSGTMVTTCSCTFRHLLTLQLKITTQRWISLIISSSPTLSIHYGFENGGRIALVPVEIAEEIHVQCETVYEVTLP